jgi:ribonuclease R
MNKLVNAIDQVVEENNLPHEWSKEIVAELKELEHKKEPKNRVDLRSHPFVTIDGKDAKDFDDAVFCKEELNGFMLQVAIADVADIVKQGTELDFEALKRGTSIYFPKKVIPMLPEEISNNLCSLVPREDRNVLVCKIIFNKEGIINSYEFDEAIINSNKRFTYNEVEYLSQDNQVNISSNILDSINALKNLTKKLLKERLKRNALEIDSAEPVLKFDNKDNINEILVPKRLFAHQMIEEAMISANICAAKFIKKHLGFGIYRIHEEPENLKIENLKKFFSLKGLSSKSFSDALELINGFISHVNKNKENKMLNILILQSLKRAQYSTKEVGHFGLQLKEYSHFTSPIRRYPDLISHRLIKNILNKEVQSQSIENFEETLDELSSLEKRAENSSRQVTQQLICHHLTKFIGDEFSSLVVGVTEFGLFCEIEKHYISGLVHVSDLSRDRYIFDKEANILKGKKTGKTFRIGQKITVQLVNVFPEERKIVLVPK